MQPEHWIAHLFSSQSVSKGEVVHLKLRDIERIVGWDTFRAVLDRRGFRALVNA